MASKALTNNTSLIQTFTDFLAVAIHTILYYRALYPPETFLSARAYNFPVRQNRHPKVCRWITNAVSSISELLKEGTVSRIVVVIFSQQGECMERILFDVSRFPVVEPTEHHTEFEPREEGASVGVSKVDVEEQLRGTMVRLIAACEGMRALPENCTYSIAVELRDEVDPPIGHPQPWIPSEPSQQTGGKGERKSIGADLGGVKSTPVRLVEAGEFILETWVEEGRAKVGDVENRRPRVSVGKQG